MKRALMLSAAIIALAWHDSAYARSTVIVLPPDYSGPKDALVRGFAAAISALENEDQILVMSADGPKRIGTVALPKDPRAANPAWRQRQLGEQFAPILRHIVALPAYPPSGSIPAHLDLPGLVEELGRNVIPSLPDKTANVLLIGSWLYAPTRDGRFAMTDRFYPSDGHISQTLGETPFGTADRKTRLNGATLHVCTVPGATEFATPQHEEAVKRFWSLWTVSQSGVVGTFGHDLSTCFDRARRGLHDNQTAYTPEKGGKIEMRRARAPVPAALPASFDRPGEYFLRDDVQISKTPPTVTTGIAWVGLKWQSDCDVDLYARSEPTMPFLFFGNPRSEDGLFNKDFIAGTGEKSWEYIEFTRPIDLAKAEIAINLYAANLSVPPEGVLRVWFAGQVYEAPFKLTATKGNKGAPPMSGAHWLKIDLLKVVGLNPS